jgi:hypothetical protein
VAKQTCKTCGKEQPETNFQKNRWGRTKVCKSCRKPREKKPKVSNPEEIDTDSLKFDPNSAGYDEVAGASIGGGGVLYDEADFRTEIKGVGKIHTRKLSARQWEARQCTYYPGMKPKPRYTPEELKKLDPFAEDYDSFWAEGYGRTEQAAIRAMRDDIKRSRKGE